MQSKNPIGIFDSGYGGLTVLSDIIKIIPEYDYIYIGDNARAPYGTKSYDLVYQYTKEAVFKLFEMGCNLVVLACNTASAKALRSIQQVDLPLKYPNKRVLGVIRPSVEAIPNYVVGKDIGIFATLGTVSSKSYVIEIEKMYGIGTYNITQVACPMLVPIVENNEIFSEGADFFVQKYINTLLDTNPKISSLLLGCTHYPILLPIIKKYLPNTINIINQGPIVANSLKDYLIRHTEIYVSKGMSIDFYTTENINSFSNMASLFMGKDIETKNISLY